MLHGKNDAAKVYKNTMYRINSFIQNPAYRQPAVQHIFKKLLQNAIYFQTLSVYKLVTDLQCIFVV
jgi:hypothetical protein